MKSFILISFILQLAAGAVMIPDIPSLETFTCQKSSETIAYEYWLQCLKQQYKRPDVFFVSGQASKNEKSTIGIVEFMVSKIELTASAAYLNANQAVTNAFIDIKKVLINEVLKTKYVKSKLTLQRYVEYDSAGQISFDGFQCQISLTVITQSINKLGIIIDTGISKNGMNGISYVSFDLLQQRKIELQGLLLTEAIKDALAKSAITLKAANQVVLALKGIFVSEFIERRQDDRFKMADLNVGASTEIFAADTIIRRSVQLQCFLVPPK